MSAKKKPKLNNWVADPIEKPKKHKHKWLMAQDQCWGCGAYSEYCTVEGCYAEKLISGDGTEQIDEL